MVGTTNALDRIINTRATLAQHNLNMTEACTLLYLLNNGKSVTGCVSKYIRVLPTSLSRVLGVLEASGKVVIAVNKEDRRSLIIDLTPEGTALARKLEEQL